MARLPLQLGKEFIEERETQFPPGGDVGAAGDVQAEGYDADQMHRTTIRPGRDQYNVRSVFDSRPVNAYDGNFTARQNLVASATDFQVVFPVPLGYRAVVRELEVQFSTNTPGNDVILFPQNNAADVPYNQIALGNVALSVNSAANQPWPRAIYKLFYIAEEATSFGVRGHSVNFNGAGNTVIVNMRVNLLVVLGNALPYSIANPIER
jgi:hypothetical protein